MSRLHSAVIACVLGCVACGGGAKPDAAATVPHGDHTPRFGGFILMNKDVHFEVVLDLGGRHRLYFSDAMRTPLPASSASEVSIVIQRRGEEPESVPMAIDDQDECWVGQGHSLLGAGEIVARISYTSQGQPPYWIDLPFNAGR